MTQQTTYTIGQVVTYKYDNYIVEDIEDGYCTLGNDNGDTEYMRV